MTIPTVFLTPLSVPDCRRLTGLLLVLCVGAPQLMANTLHVTVTANGAPLDRAVVVVYGADGKGLAMARHDPAVHIVDQVNKQFTPRISAVTVGDQISFPNSDNIRHHVYSFSPAKSFELPLYHGVPTEPVTFDVAGRVAMGCNIHDGMSADVYVVDSGVFALSDVGKVVFDDLAPGDYQLAVWHPRQTATTQGQRMAVRVDSSAASHASLTVAVQDNGAARDAHEALSPLEQKFRALRRAQD